ncbi:MAG: DPP IV N-terminal domain-containing protein, partial [Planctomycetes bacterium]|nr:DPP IV N-terminal domain-containing protein [Planctomycetota bacterium]
MAKTTPAPLLALSLLCSLAPLSEAQRGRARADGGAIWASDGVHLILDDGKWIEAESGKEVEVPKRPETPPDPNSAAARRKRCEEALVAAYGKAVPANVLRGERPGSTLPRAPQKHTGLQMTADGARAAIVIDGALYTWKDGEAAKKVLASGLEGVRHFALAPDGSATVGIEGFDLWLTHTADGKRLRLSDDGGENLFYGELDWVYQEEVYGRGNFQGAWFSPSSKYLAFLRTDENGVDTFTVVDHIPNQLGLEHLKYPKAGRINPRATLHFASVADGKRVAADLSAYKAEDEILLVRVDWTPDGKECLLMVQNREQTWLDLVGVDPATGKARKIVSERCEDGWVNRLEPAQFLADGSFLWESERTGFKHLYRYTLDGKQVAAVTSGEWEVRGVLRLDEAQGWIVVTGGAKDYAIGLHAYRATLDGKSQVQLTEGRGSHRIALNAAGTLLVDSFTHLENPGETWLRRADGSTVRSLAKKEAPANAVFPKWHQIHARDGELLDVTVTLPKDFDEQKKYPVWIDTYSGPDSATVRDAYRGPAAGTWYVGLQCNVRSASGRGMKYTKACYKQFGVQELRDLEDAVDWLCKTFPWADASRVGITGWSYGGFMTAFALTHSKKFKCGIAGAGVYDWELYDTIYTERYMATPQRNPQGYAASSVVKAAKDLHGQLLIVHGTMDDNVHLQNAIQFVHELQKAGKANFELM